MVHASFAALVVALGVAAPALAFATCQDAPPPPPAAVRTELAPPELVEPPSDGTPVQVVDAAGAPVADAIVTWFEKGIEGMDDLAPEPELARLRREFGKSVRCDAAGTARVGPFERVVASSGERYAGAIRVRRGRPLVLTLQPRRTLAVQVTDRQGRPVGEVPIELRTRADDASAGSGWTVATDAAGRAEFGPIDLFAHLDPAALRELWVAVDAPLGAPLRERLRLSALPEGPVEFTLPATGRLIVDLVDAEGAPLETVGSFTVRELWEFEREKLGEWPEARWPASRWFVVDGRSHYELPHVEAGLTFVVAADKGDDFTQGMTQVVVGPREAGETVAVRLAAPKSDPETTARVTGAIVGEDGKPLASTEVVVLWNDDDTRVTRRDLARGKTDAGGRLSAPIGRWSSSRSNAEFVPWIEVVVPRADGNGIEASGMVALPRTREIGALDFGEITVRPAPRFASGVVVDDTGAPVEGATLNVTAVPAEAGMLRGDFTDRLLTASTSVDGRFTIWGDAPRGRLSIRAGPGEAERAVPLWHASEFQELTAATAELRFVLWRCGTIVAPVVGDPEEIAGLAFGTSVIRSDGETIGGWHGGVGDDGVIETSIPIGRARLEITRGGTVVAVRDGIEVKPGADAELEPIDLSATAHQVELSIVDENGQPIEAGWIVMPNAEDDERVARMKEMFGPERSRMFPFPRRPNVSLFEDGRTTLRSDSPLPAFAVGAAGRAAVVVRNPASSERIVLEPVPFVAVVLEYEGEPLAAPLQFFVELSAEDDDEAWFRFGPDRMSRADALRLPRIDGIALVRDQPIELPIRCLGRTRLSLLLGEKTAGGFGGTTIDGDPAVIEVERSSDDQVFHVKVDRAAIDAIVKQRSDEE